MLERYYVRPETVDRIRSSWISGAIDQYVTWLVEQKYNDKSVFRRIPLLVSFGDFARAHGAENVEALPRYIEPFIEARLAERVQGRKSAERLKRISKDIRNPIQQMLHLVVAGFNVKRHRIAENPFEELAPGFFVYLRQERGLREPSIIHYSYYLCQFASYLQSIQFHDLRHLSAPVLSGFFPEFSERGGRTSVRDACGVLRVFVSLRHTCVQRLVDADVSFKVIGDYVGHRGPAATRIYSKVAIESLREVDSGDGEEILQ